MPATRPWRGGWEMAVARAGTSGRRRETTCTSSWLCPSSRRVASGRVDPAGQPAPGLAGLAAGTGVALRSPRPSDDPAPARAGPGQGAGRPPVGPDGVGRRRPRLCSTRSRADDPAAPFHGGRRHRSSPASRSPAPDLACSPPLARIPAARRLRSVRTGAGPAAPARSAGATAERPGSGSGSLRQVVSPGPGQAARLLRAKPGETASGPRAGVAGDRVNRERN